MPDGPLALIVPAVAAALGAPAGWLAWRVSRGFGDEGTVIPLLVLAAATAAAFCITAVVMPHSWILAVSLGLTWTLITLAAIDAAVMRLPDPLTLPLLAAGLLVSIALPGRPLVDHLIGAASGYAVLALLAFAYRRLRGVDGIGLGDAKLLAAAGAWLGWRPLPSVILIACAAAFAWIALVAILRRSRPASKIAFGAPLCLAIWTVWLYGPLNI